jgi:Pretoxin HINT domain
MISALLLSCGLLTAGPEIATGPSVEDRATYQAAKARAGRDPDAHVRLALWCEAHGLEAERLKHLSLAALTDPTYSTARALMGLVSEGGRWGRPESIADRARSDPAAAAVRAEYLARRDRSDYTADDQWKLARWAEEHGLTAEAMAHDTAVTRIDPTRDAAWKKLGCRKYEGRWMTAAQIEALRADREAQARADKHWLTRLEKWKDWLGKPQHRAEAEAGLLEVTDPRAVRSIGKVFGSGSPRDQDRAVRLFGQVDSTDASKALAKLGVYSGSEEIRRFAIETLRGRDLRGALDPVIQLVREPIKFQARPNLGPDSPGVILIEGKEANLQRIYPSDIPRVTSPRQLIRLPQVVERATEGANRRLADDVLALETINVTIAFTLSNAITLLRGVSGKDFGVDQGAWLAWWTDRQGYALKALPGRTGEKATFTQFVDPYPTPAHSCFAAGTPVQTVDGPRPIEDLKIGDRILTQDTTTGVLSYQPALAVFHNLPAGTLRVRLGGEAIVATGIHRFWKAGKGWTMARDLKPGDAIRQLGGIARVESVETEAVQPVFNLEVARGSSFFVGKAGSLVHDNSLVVPVPEPFDAAPNFAPVASAR